ncbi:hypothetical protein BDV25DRAFT_151350 [Aspergillus avenaceus]|uniref:Uncharacterized protein n=1 Tax=Aspergillus avenaceus TaxID=36643 RepID=A0A5N6U135_ASPAV|nr:hypothetical protein BDV25DRAFT_151350 [Aspergillus avenaceus]
MVACGGALSVQWGWTGGQATIFWPIMFRGRIGIVGGLVCLSGDSFALFIAYFL